MWEYEHQATTSATPEAIYRLWSNVGTWHNWNPDVVRAELDGPFAAGSHIVMTTTQDTIHLRLAEVEENRSFVDEVKLDGVLVRTIHRLQALENGLTLVTYRMEITGPGVDQLGPEIGPAITGDFPDTIASLVEYAER